MFCQSGRPVSITDGRHLVGKTLRKRMIKRPISCTSGSYLPLVHDIERLHTCQLRL